MLKEYDAASRKMLQIIDDNGKIINKKFFPNISKKEILQAYKDMLFARTVDLQIASYQRQGRIYTYPPSLGQEAIAVATGKIMQDEDWLVPAFREMGAYFAKGVTLKELFLIYMGNEDGQVFKNAKNILPLSVPIASQLPHAVGIAFQIKYHKEDKIVFAFVGDGGTSEGDFHESLNFAAVWQVPIVFIVQNNQYGISTPVSKQTRSENIAIKTIAYGIQGIQIDGNDYFAMYSGLKEAANYARSKQSPILIEALTYRRGAHTTSDDPTKYRSKEEEDKWAEKDPLKRLKSYLMDEELWTNDIETKEIEQYKKDINTEFIKAENYPEYKLEDVFKHLYDDIPQDLVEQQKEYIEYINWKEAHK